MPSKEVILSRTKSLPIVESPLLRGSDYKEHEIWEGDEEGAHFTITKESIPPLPFPIYSLTLSGRRTGIEKVASDFENALGEPLGRSIHPTVPGGESLVWNSTIIDKKVN